MGNFKHSSHELEPAKSEAANPVRLHSPLLRPKRDLIPLAADTYTRHKMAASHFLLDENCSFHTIVLISGTESRERIAEHERQLQVCITWSEVRAATQE